MRCRFLFVLVLSLGLPTPVKAGDLWWPGPEYPKPRKDSAPESFCCKDRQILVESTEKDGNKDVSTIHELTQ